MQYKVYTDRDEQFVCEINLTGASLNNAKSRIIVSSDTVNLMFEGKVGTDGKCIVPIKKLYTILLSTLFSFLLIYIVPCIYTVST